MKSELNQSNKAVVWDFWQSLDNSDAGGAKRAHEAAMAPDVVWNGPDPLNQLNGVDAVFKKYWQPLLSSFEELTRETHLFVSGESNGRIDGDISKDGRMWVSGTGYLHGKFTQDYLGIPATGEAVRIRWGDFYRLEGGQIVETYCLLDYVDLMQQAGIELFPNRKGVDGIYPPPAAGDGMLLGVQDEAETAESLRHIREFIYEGLNAYDEGDLKSMGMADYFHPDVQWYGPGGIGACLSFREFELNHQQPWLVAFPDRSVQDLDALIAEGAYSGGPGWAGVKAKHTGPYQDCPATGNHIDFNGLDWWKREGDVYIENWVFVDMIHLYRQFGIDLFEQMQEQIAQRH